MTMMMLENDPNATVVVCEDDDATRDLLCNNLTADRFEAIPASDAEAALRACRYQGPDLLLLDLGLPDTPGLGVLREIRDAEFTPTCDPDLPVIVLSGATGDIDRVRGIEQGADDYLVKPFHYPELVARIRAVLRRRGSERRGPRKVGDLMIDTASRRVQVAGQEIELANKEYELLRMLATDPTRVFTKKELLREIWGYEVEARTRTLDSHASRLRRKLDPERGRFVVNCWGVGFRLVEG